MLSALNDLTLSIRERLQLVWTGTVWRCSYERGVHFEPDYIGATHVGIVGESCQEVARNAVMKAQLSRTA